MTPGKYLPASTCLPQSIYAAKGQLVLVVPLLSPQRAHAPHGRPSSSSASPYTKMYFNNIFSKPLSRILCGAHPVFIHPPTLFSNLSREHVMQMANERKAQGGSHSFSFMTSRDECDKHTISSIDSVALHARVGAHSN